MRWSQWLGPKQTRYLIGSFITLSVSAWYFYLGWYCSSPSAWSGRPLSLNDFGRHLDVLLLTAVLLIFSTIVIWIYRRYSFPRIFICSQLLVIATWFVFYGYVPYNLIKELTGLNASYHDSIQFRNVSKTQIASHVFMPMNPGETANIDPELGDPPFSPDTIKFMWWYGKSHLQPIDQSKIYTKTLVAPRAVNRQIQFDIGDDGEAKITVLGVIEPDKPGMNDDRKRHLQHLEIEKKRKELLDEWKDNAN